jgi:hypothetical protein
MRREKMTKEVWITVGTVTDTESLHHGEVEYKFSDAFPGHPSQLTPYISLSKGLQDHSGHIIHWVGEIKTYIVSVEMTEHRTVYGTAKVKATNPEAALKAARESLFEDFTQTGWDCDSWEVVGCWNPIETE